MEDKSPQRWAIDLTLVLKARDGDDRFPLDVKSLAKAYSHQVFPDDPVTMLKGDDLGRFEGGLYKAPPGKKGWGIIYNSAIKSPGRINFTLAHEFGHYLVHRNQFPNGLQCSAEDMAKWDSEYGQIEQQANEFAASLLMPRDDFAKQAPPRSRPTFDQLGACANRYGVSLSAATLRWLQFSEQRTLFVVSRDGFILWSRSSPKALRSGAYIKTANVRPVPLPTESLAAQPHLLENSKGRAEHPSFVWLKEPCAEETIMSERYDKTYTLLHLGAAPPWPSEEHEGEADTFDHMMTR
ncbi:MAG: ImmA/IrrE family metallo-endopeptidase [Parasphingorhabdus sp.]|nr:ImmA/IrrE family metallo-endopeptidase [Parasphingorhabdus sp.]